MNWFVSFRHLCTHLVARSFFHTVLMLVRSHQPKDRRVYSKNLHISGDSENFPLLEIQSSYQVLGSINAMNPILSNSRQNDVSLQSFIETRNKDRFNFTKNFLVAKDIQEGPEALDQVLRNFSYRTIQEVHISQMRKAICIRITMA